MSSAAEPDVRSEQPAAASVTDREISLLDLLSVVVENLRLLVFGPVVLGLVALGIAFAIPPTFTATTRFMPPQQQQSSASMMLQTLGALGGLAGAAGGLKNPNDQYVAFLRSRSIANTLIDRFDLVARYEADLKSDARESLAAKSQIIAGKDGLISVEVDDEDPRFAAELANAYVEELGKMLDRLAVTEAQQRRVFFQTQLNQTRDKLVKAETALKSSGIDSSALKSNPEVAVRAIAELQAQIAAQEVKLASMRSYLAESAPDFVQARTELTALRGQLARTEKTTVPAPVSGADADYVSRYRDFKYYETLFELFAKQFELAKIDEAREGAVIQVVDVALTPERKSKPKRGMIAILTSLASGMLLLVFVFIRQASRNARLDPEAAGKMSRLDSAWSQALGRS